LGLVKNNDLDNISCVVASAEVRAFSKHFVSVHPRPRVSESPVMFLYWACAFDPGAWIKARRESAEDLSKRGRSVGDEVRVNEAESRWKQIS
jgi:hypothetical protein